MTEPRRAAGPGHGPGGAPTAIALTPILSARYRTRDLERIRAAAPGARIVNVSVEGLADGPVDDVEVLLRGWLSADAFDRLLARTPRLVWVHSASAGVERVLTPAGRERGLVITNARGVFSRPIAEYVMMMILAVSRRLPQLLELQHERTWQPLEGAELRDVTVGIVGLGSIGRAVGALATAFGCRVIATRRRSEAGAALAEPPDGSTGQGETPTAGPADGGQSDAGPAEGGPADAGPVEHPLGGMMLDRVLGPDGLPDLLAESDFVVLAAPLTPETEGMINDETLAQVKPGAWIINVARGRLIDERALTRALRDGRIGGAVLDTFAEEPLPPDSPFYDLPNVIVTPHTAWSTGRVLDRSVVLFCDNLTRFAAGEPLLNVVDPAVGY
jgi:phosphoglycerate dehydrogenase-like enzyme